jgi:hypothetical protein
MLKSELAELCRNENRNVPKTLIQARNIVHSEDVEGKPKTKCGPAVELAKRIVRLECRAEESDYPKSARQKYLEDEAKFETFMADFLGQEKKPTLTPEQERAKDNLKPSLMEIVDTRLGDHNDHCDDANMLLSKGERKTIRRRMDDYVEALLVKNIDDLKSEQAKDGLKEVIVEEVAVFIKEEIEGRAHNEAEN